MAKATIPTLRLDVLSDYFTARIELAPNKEGVMRVIRAEHKISYMRGWSLPEFKRYLHKRGWRWKHAA